jgi:hypothetical protein
MTTVRTLVFEDENGRRARNGSVTFADGLTFYFALDRNDGYISLRREGPHPRSRDKTVLMRCSNPRREAAIRSYVSNQESETNKVGRSRAL